MQKNQTITWGPTDSHGRCDRCPSGNEVKNVAYGDSGTPVTIPVSIPYDQCKSKEICIWVTDTSYDADGTKMIPTSCIPDGAKKCNVCGPYKITVRSPLLYSNLVGCMQHGPMMSHRGACMHM